MEDRSRWLVILTVALLVQAPLLVWFSSWLDPGESKPASRVRARLVAQRFAATPKRPLDPEAQLPEDAQIVEVPETAEPEPREALKTKHVADRRSKVSEERQPRHRSAPDERKVQGKVRVDTASEVQSKRSKSSEPSAAPESKQREMAAASRELRPLADQGSRRPDSSADDGEKARILLPSLTRAEALASLQGLSGSFASDDHLPDVKREGEETLLNANRYKYADFFYRVKDTVRRHWHPDRVYRSRDPSGRVYGVKDRYTVLQVTLDESGYLKRMVTSKRSGLDFLDLEARSAFKRAHPFPNPPSGLLADGGEVRFQFGFYFELSTGKHRFRWKRLE
jgi:TonB family protein